MEPTLYDISFEGPFPGEPGINSLADGNPVRGREITYPLELNGKVIQHTYRPGIDVRLALDTLESGTIGMAPGVAFKTVLIDRLKPISDRSIDQKKVAEMVKILSPVVEELNQIKDESELQEKLGRVCFKLGTIAVSIEGYIIDGLHRWEAYNQVALPQIACVVVNVLKEEEAEDFNHLLKAVDQHREKLKQEEADRKRKEKELEERARKAEEEARWLKSKQIGQIDGSKQYNALQRAISMGKKAFKIDDDFAYADLSPFTGVETSLTVNPAHTELSKEYVLKMLGNLNDETADFLDILYHLWISSNPKHENQHIIIHADHLMEARGVLKQKGSKGRGGYSKEVREKVKAHLESLDSLEITGSRYSYTQKKQVQYKSRVISIMDREGNYGYRIVPGSIFAASSLGLDGSRQVAKLSMKIVNYDPYRQHWEKRIGRYFSWLWRAGQQNNKEANTLKVSTLLEVIGEEKQKPYQTKQALEKALERLEQDGVIDFWSYEDEEHFVDPEGKGKGWFELYKQYKIIVYAPKSILSSYAQIENKNKLKNTKKQVLKASRLETTGERLRRVIKERNLSMRQAAEEIGIHKDTINRIINGAKPSKQAAEVIESWLQK